MDCPLSPMNEVTVIKKDANNLAEGPQNYDRNSEYLERRKEEIRKEREIQRKELIMKSKLEERRTDYKLINDVFGQNNCYLTTAAGIKNKPVSQLIAEAIEKLNLMELDSPDEYFPNAETLAEIKSIYKQLLNCEYLVRTFHSSKDVIRHLNRLLKEGQSVQLPFGMIFSIPNIVNGAFVDGHFLVLRAWKTPQNELYFKLVDYQHDPRNSERFSRNFPVAEEYIVFTPLSEAYIPMCY